MRNQDIVLELDERGDDKMNTNAKKKCRKVHGISGVIKAETLIRLWHVFFENVRVEPAEYGLYADLICSGMYIADMMTPPRGEVKNNRRYANLIGDLMQARLEPYGLLLSSPFCMEDGTVIYMVCSHSDVKKRYVERRQKRRTRKNGNKKRQKHFAAQKNSTGSSES